jgi:hypothetical protein
MSAILLRRPALHAAGHRLSSVIPHKVERSPEILGYAPPVSRRHRAADHAVLVLTVGCFVAALPCVLAVMGHLEEVHYTPQYMAYLNAQAVHRQSNPAYVSPPFVGVAHLPDHTWRYPSTHGALLFPAAGIALIVYGLRLRQPGRAG